MTHLPKLPDFRLDGKRALITGASSGIGLGAAVAIAEAGATAVLAARRRDRLQWLHGKLVDKGLSAEILVLDVSELETCSALIEAHGPFDILVNSAGIAQHTPAVETHIDDFNRVVNINISGAYFLTQAVAKGLVAAEKPGSLINISSQMGLVGGVDRAVYCATKHAVQGFTKAMAIEWGTYGIRVNTICPTFVRTSLTASTFDQPDKVAWIKRKIHLGRVAEVEDIMGAVLYLASPASAMVTGSALLIDGGWTAE